MNARLQIFLAALVIAAAAFAGSRRPHALAATTRAPIKQAAVASGNDFQISFPSATGKLYQVQTSTDLSQWTNAVSGIPGNGAVMTITIPNALSTGKGFYRVATLPAAVRLVLPTGDAFAVLGYDCGGIRQTTSVTGFDPATGNIVGQVSLSTTCSGSGRDGGHSTTHTAVATATWDFTGAVVTSGPYSGGPAVDPTFFATDAGGDVIYNSNGIAYLVVPVPSSPFGVSATEVNDAFQVSWTPNGVNPAIIVSSTVTATPINSPAPVLNTTVTGSATSGVIPMLEPLTTYEITVVNASIGGASAPSAPIYVLTEPATVVPSAPAGVTASWQILDPVGATDGLIVSWQAAVPGDSPVDQYFVTISSDSGATFTQTVSGATLTTAFYVDYTPNWTATVAAHNAAGWGPASAPVSLGGL